GSAARQDQDRRGRGGAREGRQGPRLQVPAEEALPQACGASVAALADRDKRDTWTGLAKERGQVGRSEQGIAEEGSRAEGGGRKEARSPAQARGEERVGRNRWHTRRDWARAATAVIPRPSGLV